MSKPLIIVESPAKARTIAGFLGADFVVTSSVGHIRDLPRSAADIPKKYKGEPWANLGVDVENGFVPIYIVSKEKRERHRVELPSRFQVAIDRAAMEAGVTGPDEYLAEWRQEVREFEGDLEAEAASLVARSKVAFCASTIASDRRFCEPL